MTTGVGWRWGATPLRVRDRSGGVPFGTCTWRSPARRPPFTCGSGGLRTLTAERRAPMAGVHLDVPRTHDLVDLTTRNARCAGPDASGRQDAQRGRVSL